MFFKYLIHRLAMWSVLLVVGLGIWMGVQASSVGLAHGWKEAVRKEFARQGIPISIGKLTLDPLHGLVAREVRVYQQEEPENDGEPAGASTRVIAEISRIDLDVSLAKLLRGEIYINSLHVRDANASVPLDPDNPLGERLEVSGFYSRVLFSEDSIELQELQGLVYGIDISVSGELVRHPLTPEEITEAKKNPRGWRALTPAQRDMAARLIRILTQLKTPTKVPALLRIRAMADVGRLEEGRFDFSFNAPVAEWNGLRAREISLRGNYDNGLLQAQDISLYDEGGHFHAEADFVRSSRTLRFDLDSHAVLIEKLRQHYWPETWPALEIAEAPVISLGGTLVIPEQSLKPIGLITGSLALGKILAERTEVEYLFTGLAFDGEKLFLRDVNMRAGGGVLKADVLFAGGVLQARGESTVHPETIAPFLPPGYNRNLVAAFSCSENAVSAIQFAVRGDFADLKSWDLDTRFEAANIRFHDVPIASASGRWRILPGGNHVFNDAKVTIPAGASTGVGSAHTTSATMGSADEIVLTHPPFGPTIFRNLHCSGWPHTVIAAIVPETLPAVPPFVLTTPATVVANGMLAGREGPAADLTLSLASEGITHYPIFDKVLPLEGVRATLNLKDKSAILPKVSATCFGGKVSGSLRFDGLGSKTIASRGELRLEKVGYQPLMRLFSDRKDEAKGTLDIVGSFSFKDSTFATMNAEGSMRLLNGDLFSIPLFGPLSPLIEAVLPNLGLGYSVASSATGSCVVRQGVLTTDDFTALTPSFKMDGHGTINLSTNAVLFNARFNARGLAQVATVLFSYIFEYKCEGTLGAPEWRPLRIHKIPLPKVQLPKLSLPKLSLPGRKAEQR